MLSEERRDAIAAFLRTRRARLQPEAVGLPRGRRRRTPGLRREEVASLAGVSTEWYKWLEQAREVRASTEALRRIAAALRLEPSETQHLLRLSGYGLDDESPGRVATEQVGPHLRHLLDELSPCPAWIMGARYDVLAWNRAATIVLGDLEAMTGIERNAVYQTFFGELCSRQLADWPHHARGLVGTLRVQFADRVGDPWFQELVDTLRQRSPDFAHWWNDYDVSAYQDGVKHYDHPRAGRLSFEYTVLRVADERFAELSLIAYVPLAATGTREKVLRLLGGEPAVDAGVALRSAARAETPRPAEREA